MSESHDSSSEKSNENNHHLQHETSGWMPLPPVISSNQQYLSPYLVYLTKLDYLLVRQIVDMEQMLQFFVGINARVKFGIFNNKNQQIYFAYEESNCFERFCLGSNRSFIIHIVNNLNQEVIRIRRNLKCCIGSCFCLANSCECCTDEAFVEAPPGIYIGKVRQRASCCRSKFDLINESEEIVLSTISNYCVCNGPFCCCCENKFTIFGSDGQTEIGAIHKKYAGFINEAFTEAELFTITFPKDLDVRMKAVGLAALFLINMMHFSPRDNKRQNVSYV